MGARPSTFKKGGGGFLNGVDGEIVSYRFTDQFNGEDFVPGKKPGTKDEKFHSLYMELKVRLDGADEDITQSLFAGGYDDFEISEDELTLTSASGDECSIGANTATGKFVQSLVEAGFPESKFSDDPNSVNFEPMVGARVRFGQAQQMGKDGKPLKRVVKKGKFKGREFDNTTTVVEQVYESGGKADKGAKNAKADKGGKKKKDEDAEDDDVPSLAKKFLLKVVTASKNKLAKGKLSMALLKPENGLFKHPEREAIRKLLTSDKFLNTEDGWKYNDDKEIITIEEDEDNDDGDEDDE